MKISRLTSLDFDEVQEHDSILARLQLRLSQPSFSTKKGGFALAKNYNHKKDPLPILYVYFKGKRSKSVESRPHETSKEVAQARTKGIHSISGLNFVAAVPTKPAASHTSSTFLHSWRMDSIVPGGWTLLCLEDGLYIVPGGWPLLCLEGGLHCALEGGLYCALEGGLYCALEGGLYCAQEGGLYCALEGGLYCAWRMDSIVPGR